MNKGNSMGVRVDPSLVDWDRMRKTVFRVTVDPCFLDWKKVAESARAQGKTLEEVLGIEPIRPIPKRPGIVKRFEENLDKMARESGKTKGQVLEEARNAGLKRLESDKESAERLGVSVGQLLTIQRIMLRYGDFDDLEQWLGEE